MIGRKIKFYHEKSYYEGIIFDKVRKMRSGYNLVVDAYIVRIEKDKLDISDSPEVMLVYPENIINIL